jgi:molybdopterin adenylyltransferase
MSRIDESKPFLPVNIAILTVSDTRHETDDKSGQTLADLAKRDGHRVVARTIVKDDVPKIIQQLEAWIADPLVDVVVSTGGTGLTGRDVTPEAFRSVYDKEIEGFGELFRMVSYDKIKSSTMQSRATGGVAGGTYLFALPGSPGACRDGWEEILRWQLDSRHRPACRRTKRASRCSGALSSGSRLSPISLPTISSRCRSAASRTGISGSSDAARCCGFRGSASSA